MDMNADMSNASVPVSIISTRAKRVPTNLRNGTEWNA